MTEKICFIVTAIGESGTETRDRSDEVFSYLISPVCEELGYKPVRVDQVDAVDNINETIINYLKTAPMVVADMTGHNPNAFYELGFRQALELPLVPIIQAGNRLPFDVISQRTVFYNLSVGKIGQSKKDLKAKMKSFENFRMPESSLDKSLTLDDVNDNLNKKLDKILNLLEKNQPNSSLEYSNGFNLRTPQIDYQSLIKRSEDRITQIQSPLSSLEDKK